MIMIIKERTEKLLPKEKVIELSTPAYKTLKFLYENKLCYSLASLSERLNIDKHILKGVLVELEARRLINSFMNEGCRYYIINPPTIAMGGPMKFK
jgi:DNA-binding MarR family transcriptional regulator